MKRLLLICVLVISFSGFCRAQLTIGSEVKPAQGAILDLKQEDKQDGSANSKKGLGLPRVVLKSLTIPGGETSLASTIDQASGDWKPEKHIGLVIYNVKPEGEIEICPVDPVEVEMILVGPHVWDGNQWQYLGMSQELAKEDRIEILLDERDGNEYRYRAFGDPSDPDNFAGYWTLENACYVDEENMSNFAGKEQGSLEMRSQYYFYPNDDISNTTGTKPTTWRPNQGLLYTYSAATMGAQDALWESDAESQGQESGPTETTPIIQGVCPDGWHVPTDREWNKLAKVIFNNPDKYSTYAPSFGLDPNSVEWNSDLEIGEIGDPVFQGVADENNGLGVAMLSSCSPLIMDNGEIGRTVSVGKSKSSFDGGFNLLLVGSFSETAKPEETYNQAAAFWTSSLATPEGSAWSRLIIGSEPQGMLRLEGPAQDFSSVRCKRDN